jgi:hypothetical protein
LYNQSERKRILTALCVGADWQKSIMAAHEKCREEGENWGEVYPKTLEDMMDKFRAHKAAVDRETAAADTKE